MKESDSCHKVLVTGSKGFLGRYVVKELEESDYEVVHFDIKDGEWPDYDIRTSDFKELDGVDAVIHLAAYVGLVKCFYNPVEGVRTNVLGTVRLLQACKERGIKRFVFASTWAVNGKKVNPYDITKDAGESLVKSYGELHGLSYAILRFGTAYGSGMRKEGVIQNFIEKVKRDLPLEIHGRGEQIRQFTHACDIARGVRLAVESEKVGVWDITTPEVVSVRHIAEMFGTRIVHKPSREQDEDYEVIDTGPAERDLDFRARVSLEDGVGGMRYG